jgi:hypothetical protein
MIRILPIVIALLIAPVIASIAMPSTAIAQDKDAEKKKKDKKRGEPVKKVEPIITQLPGISDNARCQAEVAVAAFKRLGALPILLYMPSGLANAAAAGTTAAMGYCAHNVKACTDSAEVLLPKVGELPPSCNG